METYTPKGYYHSLSIIDRSTKTLLCVVKLGVVTNLSRAEKFRESLQVDNPDKVFLSTFMSEQSEFNLPFNHYEDV